MPDETTDLHVFPDYEDVTEETYEISETLDYVSPAGELLEYGSSVIEETVPLTTDPVYISVIQDASLDIVHASLFGSFLICGTLVGIFLLRGRYGT